MKHYVKKSIGKKIEIPIGSRHFLTSEAECPERERKGRGGERV